MKYLSGLLVFLVLYLNPGIALASDMSGLIILVSVPMALVTFIVCMSIALLSKTKDVVLAIALLNLPNWLFCIKTFLVGLDAGASSDKLIFTVISLLIIGSSVLPFWILNNRHKKLKNSTATEHCKIDQ